MVVLDAFLSWSRAWRRFRGGVWERWEMERGGPIWWGPTATTTAERVRIFADRAPAAVVTGAFDPHEMARPDEGCRGTPVVEDYR